MLPVKKHRETRSSSLQVDLVELGRSPKFRKFYRLMCEMLGIKLILVDHRSGRHLTLDYERDAAPLCAMLQRDPLFASRCRQCDKTNCELAIESREGRLYRCHAGLFDLVVPVFISGSCLGSFIGGQILPEPPSEKSFKRFLAKLKGVSFDPDALRAAYFKTPFADEAKMRKLLEIIGFFAEYFYELGPRIVDRRSADPRIEKAKDFIAKRMREPLSLKDVASFVGLSSVRFGALFKRECGTGFHSHLERLRLAHAANMLDASSLSVGEIAAESGFSSVRTFNRAFSKTFGASPRERRRSGRI